MPITNIEERAVQQCEIHLFQNNLQITQGNLRMQKKKKPAVEYKRKTNISRKCEEIVHRI